ncbi:MAG TPA: nuclear transport factor 2 family protein [Pyrinomonadaceae bacterium]|nr:nuclear transport factor 2 family protein [Pyrinomonadaceae bacterium]
MVEINKNKLTFLAILLVFFCGASTAQNTGNRTAANVCNPAVGLNGVYRIDVEQSDKLYSVIESATTKVPYAEQQQFFMDLAVRLTPPDLLAIECSGSRVFLGSSRAPRIAFQADGVTRNARAADGRVVRSRIGLERDSLVFNSGGGGNDTLSFTFTPLENGERLRVTRRISSEELIEPVIIQTVYNKIDRVARWDIYGEPLIARQRTNPNIQTAAAPVRKVESPIVDNDDAGVIRNALYRWIDATNGRDIDEQMSFYMPELKAFYLARNASRSAVRLEKTRVFASAKSIDIRAEEPEIIFQDGGRTAVMRFRKKYRVDNRRGSRRGEVVQELRWRQTNGGWKIFSERDIKVIS